MAARKNAPPQDGAEKAAPLAEALERGFALDVAFEQLASAGLTAPLPDLPALDAPVPPDVPGAIITARPDSLSRADQAARMRIVREICQYLELETTPTNAANLAGYSLDEVEALMIADPLARRMLLRASAKGEFNMVQRVRSGAKGASKAALEMLARTRAGWAVRTQQNLVVQFEGAIRELKLHLGSLPQISGADALKIVLDTLEKYSR